MVLRFLMGCSARVSCFSAIVVVTSGQECLHSGNVVRSSR